MLRPIRKAIRAALARRGYDLHRSTRFEMDLVRSLWPTWFSHDAIRFGNIYARNRRVLATIEHWTDPTSLAASLWRYGVPEVWDTGPLGADATGLNEIEPEISAADLIAYVGGSLGEPVRYLEIGVSVGKNFVQVAQHFDDVVGLDVERINPTLLRHFPNDEIILRSEKRYSVETLSGTPAEVHIEHHRLSDSVIYVRGDQYAADTWASLKPRTFNLIFSDGVHSPRAVRSELDFLIDCRLIPATGPFAMVWDDLVYGEMQKAFVDNCERLKTIFPDGSYCLYWIHGSYGDHRVNGMFWSLPKNGPGAGPSTR